MTKEGQKSFRVVQLILLALLATGTAYAQSQPSTGDSGVEVLKLKWEKQARLPGNFDPSVIPENGIFSSMESRTSVPGSTQAPYGDEARRDAAARSAALGPVDYFPKSPSRIPISYLYSLTIRNVSTKTIKAVAWDYLFVDRPSQRIVGNHHLLSNRIVHPGERVTLNGSQRTQPISVVAANPNENKKESTRPLERGAIQCVLYEDKTTWRNPSGRADICELLKNHQPVRTSKIKDQATR